MKKLLYLSTIALTLLACQKNEPDDLFGKNPSQRSQESQAALRQELTAAEHGWKLTYFTNQEKFGGFTFLMKFSPDGLVEMASDVSTTASATTSKYEIKQGQGTMLSFVTKNYIHELADSFTPSDLRGKGYEGEFEFIYYGKEGNKLKFRTQRKDNQQYLYFEPASSQDWNNLTSYASNISTLENNIDNYYFTVSTTTNISSYKMNLSYRYLSLESLTDNEKQKTPIVATATGIAFKNPLSLQGKSFTELIRENGTNTATYQATVDGVTAKIVYSLVPPEEFISDDYKDLENRVVALILLTQQIKGATNLAQIPFYENVLKATDTTDFTRIQFVFNGPVCLVAIGYNFNGTESFLIARFSYELKNKRLYLKNKLNGTPPAIWQTPANSAILQKARSSIDYVASIAADGFYVKKLSRRVGNISNTAYTLQSHNTPEDKFAIYAQYR